MLRICHTPQGGTHSPKRVIREREREKENVCFVYSASTESIWRGSHLITIIKSTIYWGVNDVDEQLNKVHTAGARLFNNEPAVWR